MSHREFVCLERHLSRMPVSSSAFSLASRNSRTHQCAGCRREYKRPVVREVCTPGHSRTGEYPRCKAEHRTRIKQPCWPRLHLHSNRKFVQ